MQVFVTFPTERSLFRARLQYSRRFDTANEYTHDNSCIAVNLFYPLFSSLISSQFPLLFRCFCIVKFRTVRAITFVTQEKRIWSYVNGLALNILWVLLLHQTTGFVETFFFLSFWAIFYAIERCSHKTFQYYYHLSFESENLFAFIKIQIIHTSLRRSSYRCFTIKRQRLSI